MKKHVLKFIDSRVGESGPLGGVGHSVVNHVTLDISSSNTKKLILKIRYLNRSN